MCEQHLDLLALAPRDKPLILLAQGPCQVTSTLVDGAHRPECRAMRMNPAINGALPASACSPGTTGSFGPDRITKTIYDLAGQVTQQQVAVGTADLATEATFTYTNNGKLLTLKDGVNNLTTYEYDGFDRLAKTRYPVTAKGAGASSATDFEQLTYDVASNVTQWRLRDGGLIDATYDSLDRQNTAPKYQSRFTSEFDTPRAFKEREPRFAAARCRCPACNRKIY